MPFVCNDPACPRDERDEARTLHKIVDDRISILDARGLHGEATGADAAGSAGQTNLADAAVAAAMRYRVGGPLIDGLMAELGMTGGSLNGMLAGSVPDGAPADSARKPSTALNGGTAASDVAPA